MVVAVLTITAGLIGVSAAPAGAATCTAGSGVSVVVNFSKVPSSRGEESRCAPNSGGKYASTIFRDAKFALGYYQGQSGSMGGYVCQVDGLPDVCGQPDARKHWWLFWSDGKSGKWADSSFGVSQLKVPDGGSVALVYRVDDQPASPSTTPPSASSPSAPGGAGKGAASRGKSGTKHHSPAQAKPTPRGGTGGSHAATPKASTPRTRPNADAGRTGAAPKAGAKGTRRTKASTSASASRKTPGARPGATPSAAPDATPTPSPTGAPDAARNVSSREAPEQPGGLPAWVPILVLLVLAGGAGSALWWRGRQGA